MKADIKPVYVRMTSEDLDDVARIESESFSAPWSRKAFEDALNDRNYIFYVARVDKKVIGTAGLIVSFDEADVTNVAVDKDYRGMGVATDLLLALLEKGMSAGIKTFTLEVRENNSPAIALYEKAGFIFIGKRPGFYDKPREDALMYQKKTD